MAVFNPSAQRDRIFRLLFAAALFGSLPLKADRVVLHLCASNWDGRQSISGVVFKPKFGAPGPATGPDGCADIDYYLDELEVSAPVELTVKFPRFYEIIAPLNGKLRLRKGEHRHDEDIGLMRKEQYEEIKRKALNGLEEISKTAQENKIWRRDFLVRVSASTGAPVLVIDGIIRSLGNSLNESERKLVEWYSRSGNR
jgi:hypothetical protein